MGSLQRMGIVKWSLNFRDLGFRPSVNLSLSSKRKEVTFDRSGIPRLGDMYMYTHTHTREWNEMGRSKLR